MQHEGAVVQAAQELAVLAEAQRLSAEATRRARVLYNSVVYMAHDLRKVVRWLREWQPPAGSPPSDADVASAQRESQRNPLAASVIQLGIAAMTAATDEAARARAWTLARECAEMFATVEGVACSPADAADRRLAAAMAETGAIDRMRAIVFETHRRAFRTCLATLRANPLASEGDLHAAIAESASPRITDDVHARARSVVTDVSSASALGGPSIAARLRAEVCAQLADAARQVAVLDGAATLSAVEELHKHTARWYPSAYSALMLATCADCGAPPQGEHPARGMAVSIWPFGRASSRDYETAIGEDDAHAANALKRVLLRYNEAKYKSTLRPDLLDGMQGARGLRASQFPSALDMVRRLAGAIVAVLTAPLDSVCACTYAGGGNAMLQVLHEGVRWLMRIRKCNGIVTGLVKLVAAALPRVDEIASAALLQACSDLTPELWSGLVHSLLWVADKLLAGAGQNPPANEGAVAGYFDVGQYNTSAFKQALAAIGGGDASALLVTTGDAAGISDAVKYDAAAFVMAVLSLYDCRAEFAESLQTTCPSVTITDVSHVQRVISSVAKSLRPPARTLTLASGCVGIRPFSETAYWQRLRWASTACVLAAAATEALLDPLWPVGVTGVLDTLVTTYATYQMSDTWGRSIARVLAIAADGGLRTLGPGLLMVSVAELTQAGLATVGAMSPYLVATACLTGVVVGAAGAVLRHCFWGHRTRTPAQQKWVDAVNAWAQNPDTTLSGGSNISLHDALAARELCVGRWRRWVSPAIEVAALVACDLLSRGRVHRQANLNGIRGIRALIYESGVMQAPKQWVLAKLGAAAHRFNTSTGGGAVDTLAAYARLAPHAVPTIECAKRVCPDLAFAMARSMSNPVERLGLPELARVVESQQAN